VYFISNLLILYLNLTLLGVKVKAYFPIR